MNKSIENYILPSKEEVLALGQKFDSLFAIASPQSHTLKKLRHEVKSPISELISYVNAFGSLKGEFEESLIIKYYDSLETLKSIEDPFYTSVFDPELESKAAIHAYKTHPETKKLLLYESSDIDIPLVNANRIDVKKTIFNFLTNVDRHSDSPTIEVKVENKGTHVGISVLDFGSHPALDFKSTKDESLEHIFLPGSSAGKGFGDAMYVYREDLRKNGGDIIVDYALPQRYSGGKGVGSKFTALLPVVKYN